MSVTEGQRDRPGLVYLTARHLYRTLVYTPIYFVGIGLITYVFSLAALLNPSHPMAKYVLLAIAGWALYAGQLHAVEGFSEQNDNDYSRFTDILVSVASVLYYNFMILIALLGAFVAEAVGFPDVAVTVAFIGPIIDFEVARQYRFGLVLLLLRVTVWFGERTTETYENSWIEHVVETTTKFLSHAKDAVPPAMSQLSLRSLMARRRDRI